MKKLMLILCAFTSISLFSCEKCDEVKFRIEEIKKEIKSLEDDRWNFINKFKDEEKKTAELYTGSVILGMKDVLVKFEGVYND